MIGMDAKPAPSDPILRYAMRGLGASLVFLAFVVWWWSDDLMLLLISKVGEVRALGADSVVHVEHGERLLTNPGAMMAWTLPIWVAALVQAVGGAMLLCISKRRT